MKKAPKRVYVKPEGFAPRKIRKPFLVKEEASSSDDDEVELRDSPSIDCLGLPLPDYLQRENVTYMHPISEAESESEKSNYFRKSRSSFALSQKIAI